MADNDMFLFSVSAGKILAKMHLAGREKYKEKKEKYEFFNTGIINDMLVSPEDIDQKSKIDFDFANEHGIYEVGVLMLDFNAPIKSSPEEILNADKKDLNEDTPADTANKKSGILDTAEDVEKKKRDLEKKQDSVDQSKQKDNDKSAGQDDGGNQTEDHFSEKAKKMLADNRQIFNKYVEEKKKVAIEVLKEYMQSFAGKESASKITPDCVRMVYLPPKNLDPTKVKYQNYEIAELEPQQVSDMFDKLLKDPKIKSFKLNNVCFKLMYKMKIETEK